jgi:hypothetical protein
MAMHSQLLALSFTVLVCPAVLVAGYYAGAMEGRVVTAVSICPQKYYCPGGSPVAAFDPSKPAWRAPTETTIFPCPDGLWTEGLGAKVAAQCCE